jgi:hypothetical protein
MKELPTGKSPGPDGFQIDFIQLWDMVGQDLFEACKETFRSKPYTRI